MIKPGINFELSKQAFDNYVDAYNYIATEEKDNFHKKYLKENGNDNLWRLAYKAEGGKETIKSPHMQTYYDLLRIFRIDFGNEVKRHLDNKQVIKMLLEDQDTHVFHTNRKQIAHRTNYKDVSTPHRHLERLEDAGVLTRKYHGRNKNIGLLIRPDLLLVTDVNNSDYELSTPFLTMSGNELVTHLKAEICNISQSPNEHNNIVICCSTNSDKAVFVNSQNSDAGPAQLTSEKTQIPADAKNENHLSTANADLTNTVSGGTASRADLVTEQNPNISPNSGEKAECHQDFQEKNEKNCEIFAKNSVPAKFSSQYSNKNNSDESGDIITKNPKVSAAIMQQKKEQRFQKFLMYKMFMAKWILAYAIDMLYSHKSEIFKSERELTIQYIYDNYFAKCRNMADLERYKLMFKWCIDAAHRHGKRNNFKISVFPSQYFHLNSKSAVSFIRTLDWYKDNLRYQVQKHENKTKLSDNDKLNSCIKQYCDTPTHAMYKRLEQYVIDNIPNLKYEFYQYFQ